MRIYDMEKNMERYFCKYGLVALRVGVVVFLLIVSPHGLNAQANLGRGRISGMVVDEEKRPLEGVLIVAQSLTALNTKLETKTGKKGYFAIGGLGTGMWRITAAKSGFMDAYQDIDVHQLKANPPVVLVLKDSVASTGAISEKGASDSLNRGNQLLAEEKYEEARIIFEKFLSQSPESYQIRLQIGMCWLKQGDLDKAEAELKLVLDKVLQTSGSYEKAATLSMQALAGLGEAAIKRNDIVAGQKLFRQALEVSPTNEILAYNVAEILFSNQKTDEAIQYYLLAIQIKKEWSKPYYKLGIVYLNKGDFTHALEYLRQFVALDPNNPETPQVRNIIDTIEKIKN